MKTFLIILFLPFIAKAQITPPPIAEEHRWLYESVIPQQIREARPNESFKSFWVHLPDSNTYFPKPELITSANLKITPRIQGTMRYVFLRKAYNYDVLQNADGSLILSVRIFLKDPAVNDIKNFREKLQIAENIWNQNRVAMDFDYSFKFEITEDALLALYSVDVLDDTRGPYNVRWGRSWSSTTIAHELGHMLGLGDEYSDASVGDCLEESLMCNSFRGRLMPYHFYFILRRFVNQ